MCDIEKTIISIHFFLITIIRHFAECVIVLIIGLPWTAAVFDILHILCCQFTSVIN